MKKIIFANNQAPAVNDINLNKMQDNMEEALKWQSQAVSLGNGEKATVEGIKTANEVYVIFGISGVIRCGILFPKILSGTGMSMLATDGTTKKSFCKVTFETGQVQNGAANLSDNRIIRVLWR